MQSWKKPLDQTRYQLVAKMATIVRPPFFSIKIHSHTSICRAHKMHTDSTNSIKLKLKNISLWLFFLHKNGNQAKQKCAMFYHLASSDNKKWCHLHGIPWKKWMHARHIGCRLNCCSVAFDSSLFFLFFFLFLFRIYQQKMGKKSLRQSTAAAAATATALALARHDTSITAKKCVFKRNAKQVQLLQILDENK